MALEDFKAEPETDDKDEQADEKQKRPDSTKRAVAASIQSRSMTSSMFDVEVENGRVNADIEDLAMMFCLMTMDFTEADFTSLVTDGVDNDP